MLTFVASSGFGAIFSDGGIHDAVVVERSRGGSEAVSRQRCFDAAGDSKGSLHFRSSCKGDGTR